MFKKIFSHMSIFLVALITIIFAFTSIIAMSIFGRKTFFPLAKYWAKIILFVSRIEVKETINQIVNEDKSYIYIPNHSSLFDIPVLLSTIKSNTRIMYKEELEKVPVFGWCLKMSPYIGVKREDKDNSLEGFKQALEAINKSDSVIIFAEGTRSKDGSLGEFKKGAFLLAIKSGKEIVPVVIKGTNELMAKGSFSLKKGNVTIEYFQIIDPKENPDISTKKLMENIRELMISNISK